MTKNITSACWRGEYAEPIDPTAMQFTAEPATRGCKGCHFDDQRAAVCNQVGIIAERLELPACSPRTGPTFIYVLDRATDPRQLRVRQDGSAVQEGARP